MDISKWLNQSKWIFNDDNTDTIKARLKTITNDDSDAQTLYDAITADDLNINAVKNAQKVWDKLKTPANNYRLEQQMGVYHLANEQWPLPSPSTIYTVIDDVIHPAKNLVKNDQFVNQTKANEYVLHILGFALSHKVLQDYSIYVAPSGAVIKNILESIAHADSLGVDIKNDSRFDNLAKFMATFKEDDLVAPIITNDYAASEYETSDNFQNITRFMLNHNIDAGDLYTVPSNYQQTLAPTKILIFNAEEIANSVASDIDDVLKEIRKLTNNFKLKRVSSFKLVTRSADFSSPVSSKSYTRDDKSANRRADVGGQVIADPAARVHRIMQWAQQRTNQASSNKTTIRQRSFMKANRRHPNNPNVAGRITKSAYKRDIHIYLDTSGSISSSQYRTGIQVLVEAAKRLNVDIYFSSFSHIVSSPVKLPTKNKTRQQIQNILMQIPKVSGGTDYENVYSDIVKSSMEAQKRHQSVPINIILTDFEYSLPYNYRINSFVANNTFYMPLDPKNNLYSKVNFMKQVVYAASKSSRFVKNHFA